MADYCLIEGGYPGIGNIDEAPLLVDIPGEDYRQWGVSEVLYISSCP